MATLKELTRRLVVYLLTLEAKAVLKKYHPKIILVTGSVGKTSTKDAAYTALAGAYFTRKSEKSFNSDIGVPLTILGVPNGWGNPFQWLRNLLEGFFMMVMQAPYPEWLVMEVGADRPGDIRALSWLSPDVVVATRFPEVSVHVEYYESPEAVIQEELAPAWWLKAGGVYVANADDPRALAASTKDGVRRVSYGFGKHADIRAMRYRMTATQKSATGVSFDAVMGEAYAHVALRGVLGEQHASAVLGGIAGAVAAGVPFSQAAEAFASHEPPPGRMRLIPGMHGSVIIDDSYNASPAATEKALEALSAAPHAGRRIAVLADMLELGAFSVDEHARIGQMAAKSADILVTAGIRARDIARGAREAGMPPENIFECERGAEAGARLVSLIGEGDIVLIKGSQSMRMERVVKSVMAEPQRAKEMLVRQDAEWLSR